MKIGIFDSGLGGLWILSHLKNLLPEYDYVFLADQAYVPYGNKTKEELFERATKILKQLYELESCSVVLIACNTNSTSIYNELKIWVKENYSNKELLGIVKPTIESIPKDSNTVFFGTHRTIDSHVYKNEFNSISNANVLEIELPKLASMIEEGEPCEEYLKSFNNSIDDDCVGVLVCTHYGIVRSDFKNAFPNIKKWIYQEDIIPNYIKQYLEENHSKEEGFSKNKTIKIFVTKENLIFNKFLSLWFEKGIKSNFINL